MKKEFVERVLKETIVDTEKYRYVATALEDGMHIKRLPIEELGTTAAFDEWETVKVVK